MNIKSFIPRFAISWYHFLLALSGAILYGFPSRRLIVIGVTGTKGKSTVASFISKIFEEAGYKSASLTSISFRIGEDERPNNLKMTMPGRFIIQRFLRKAVDSGCAYAVLEVTSEGMDQHRHRFINFNTAVFTNLAPEHIEAHGSFEKYRTAKMKLFNAAKKVHIVNLDNENVKYFLGFSAGEKWGFSVKSHRKAQGAGKMRIINAEEIVLEDGGSSFIISGMPFKIRMPGIFNIYNALAAICVACSNGIDIAICKRAFEKIEGVPGRMEVVVTEPFTAVVDYAHTPDSLENVYRALKTKKDARMICVLGSAGGGRDKWKRPELGKIADNYCDEIIITNEDPYDENPEKILDEIFSGFSNSKLKTQNSKLYRILDRREAIKKALTLASPNDVVIITGKGCEPWMCVENGKKVPWDDRQIVREELAKIKNRR